MDLTLNQHSEPYGNIDLLGLYPVRYWGHGNI